MPEEKILSGDQIEKNSGTVLSGEEGMGIVVAEVGKGAGTLKERISLTTESGGLKQLPDGFDEQNGDWIAINSTNPFEVLYLDYKQNKFITSEFVRNNYDILFKFWKNKCDSIGANRDRFEKKYGIRPFEKCLSSLENAYKKLNSKEGIENYYVEINNERLRNGEEKLKNSINVMLSDASADKTEIEYCINEGLQHELTKEETAVIIKKAFDSIELKPYGAILGNTLLEKLLSVDHWMPQHKIDEAERLKREQESLKIQILPGKYASTIEEIGTILFGDINEAKEIIKEDLLKQAIAQKDIVLAREVGKISKDTKNIETVYLEIIYKLNRNLPFRFDGKKLAKTVEELCGFIFENDQTLKIGKEDLKKGYTEIWLKLTNTNAYNNFITIRDSAENVELAFLEFLHTFNKTLPYRFAGKILVKSLNELSEQINKSQDNWNAGKKELFNSSILVWLKTTGKSAIIEKWNKIKSKYKGNEDVGLEEFLHLLNEKIEYARIIVDNTSLSFPKIQSGKTVTAAFNFSNETRGYVNGGLTFSKSLDGVILSSEDFSLNAAAGVNNSKITFTIDTTNLLKGVGYETIIQLNTSTNQKIDIPVSFKVVFPTNAFIIETLKYAAILSAFFVLIRLIIASSYPDWLKTKFNYFLDWDNDYNNYGDFAVFGWTFLLFFAGISTGTYFLIKYLLSDNKNLKATNDNPSASNKTSQETTKKAKSSNNTTSSKNSAQDTEVTKSAEIIFAVNVESSGKPIQQSESFIISPQGNIVYVIISSQQSFNTDKFILNVWKSGTGNKMKEIENRIIDVQKDLEITWLPFTFNYVGYYCFQVYTQDGKTKIGEGYVTIQKK